MNKKVCMFVWNHFTNDARVLRECTALSEDGYDVDLVCIHDPSDPDLLKYEERNSSFKIYRVRRYPATLELLNKTYRTCMKHKYLAIIPILLLMLGFYFIPIVTAIATILLLSLWKTKARVLWVRGSIIVRMIARGFSKKYDVYHSNDLNTLPQGFICSKLRINKKKLVYDSHEVQTSRTGYESSFHGKLEAFLITKIDAMIVENHTRAKYNEELYGFYPNVVHNYPFKEIGQSTEIAPLHQLLGLPKDEKILLYQGGIQTGRGLDKLIQAAPHFTEGTLVLIGDGRIKPELQKMVEKMKLEEKVKFLPKVPLEELPKYTKNAYLGFQVLNNVCFNHYSASSNKLFEYMMAGVPVVACSFPEIKKVVEGENIGICVDSHDFVEIASAVNELLENKVMYKIMAGNCQYAIDKYNWELEKKKFLLVYLKILAVECCGGIFMTAVTKKNTSGAYEHKQIIAHEKMLDEQKEFLIDKLRKEKEQLEQEFTEILEFILNDIKKQEERYNKKIDSIKNETELVSHYKKEYQDIKNELQLQLSKVNKYEKRIRSLETSFLGKITLKYWEFRRKLLGGRAK